MKFMVVSESEMPSKVIEVEIGGKKLITPSYFPAISSYGIKYSFSSLIRLFLVYSYPRVLVSAYDLHFLPSRVWRELRHRIEEYSSRLMVFLDSGVYESYWKHDRRWNLSLYKKTLASIKPDFFASFDALPGRGSEGSNKNMLGNIRALGDLCDRPGFVPIFHGMNSDRLVLQVKEFMKNYPDLCDLVAIPERDCGDEFFEKARTVHRIRSLLDEGNESNHSRVLHVLGCGNPISLLLFSYCGANMFDSLDWIKHAVDPNRLTIGDFSHLELMRCNCDVCVNFKGHYVEKVLLHNLLFYQNYMLRIQSLIIKNGLRQLLERYINQDLLQRITNSQI